MKLPPNFLTLLLGWLLLVSGAKAATEYVEGEALVTFKPAATLETARAVLKKRSLSFAAHFGALSAQRKRQTGLVREARKTTAQLIAELKADPDVESAEPNYLRWVHAAPNDPRFAEMWALKNTGQTVNGKAGTASADVKFPEARGLFRPPLGEVVVGVIDTGLDATHPDLAANVWINARETRLNGVDDDGNGFIDDASGYDFASSDADPTDSGEHGTHVSGTIAAVGDNGAGVIGISEKVRLLPLKVSSDGDSISSAATIAALQYATALKNRGVNIVALNASYGGGGFSATEQAAIQAAGDAGIVFCAAAGNSSANNDTTPTYPASYRLANMIVVAATDQNDALASYSDYGATTVDLAAPGSNILSTKPSTVTFQAGSTTYSSTAMAFSGATTGLAGNLVDCGTGNTSAEFPAAVSGNIALMLRGTENFSTKVTNAMAAGARAAIIYNNVAGTFTGTLQTAANWIPTRAIAQADGLAIKAALPKVGTIVVTGNYQFLDGTSMATPHVTGAVALAAMNFPGDTVAQRRQRILASVDPLPGLQGKVATGGRLNLLRLVDANANGLPDWQPAITTATLPGAIVGDAYTQSFAVSEGAAPYAWSVAGGALPPGFVLSSAGVLSGPGTAAGNFAFTVQVADSVGTTATRAFTLGVTTFGALDHFAWDYLPASAYAGVPFAVRVTARDAGGRLVTTAGGSANLTATRAGVAATLPLSPASVPLSSGAFVGYLTINTAAAGVTLTATQGAATGAGGGLGVSSAASFASDGLPDSWKTTYGLSTAANVAALDSDGDGLTNRQEFAAGTNPAAGSSVLRITSTSTDGTTFFALSFPGIAGKLYRISTSTDLSLWTPLSPTILPATSGVQTVSIPVSGPPAEYFRVEIVPSP